MSMDTIDFSRLPLAGQRVLDVGCGEGRHCLSAAYQGAAQVVGVKNYFQVLRVCFLPAVVTAVWGILVILGANWYPF